MGRSFRSEVVARTRLLRLTLILSGLCSVLLLCPVLMDADDKQPADKHDVEIRPKPGETEAQAYDRFVEEKLKLTFPATATRMLAECGGIKDGICIDLGCGGGHLDVELAKRSNFKIIGLDINADMKPVFEKRMAAAGLTKRVTFVHGDAQKLPFPDQYADIIVSRGMLIFLPDIKKCLKEVDRVLKPTGVAFLGGRYLYAPAKYKMTADKLRQIVADSGVPGAQAIDFRGQWVKIVKPQAPQAARSFGMGPGMFAHRLLADYGITQGDCLLINKSDGSLERALEEGLVDATQLRITVLYPSEKIAEAARARLQQAKRDQRILCKVGDVHALPFEAANFDLVASLGAVPFWRDQTKAFGEIHRVLKPGGVALAGGMYKYMPAFKKVSAEELRQAAAKTGISAIRVYEDMGQWVEIRKDKK